MLEKIRSEMTSDFNVLSDIYRCPLSGKFCWCFRGHVEYAWNLGTCSLFMTDSAAGMPCHISWCHPQQDLDKFHFRLNDWQWMLPNSTRNAPTLTFTLTKLCLWKCLNDYFLEAELFCAINLNCCCTVTFSLIHLHKRVICIFKMNHLMSWSWIWKTITIITIITKQDDILVLLRTR